MGDSPVVLIGPSDRLDALKERTESAGELLTFDGENTLEALQAITNYRPSQVVIERQFATSSRGSALITRIRQDPSLNHAEIRIASHETEHERVLPQPPEIVKPVPEVKPEAKSPLDYRGTRRATRYTLAEGVVIKVDGDPATVIDMSRIGAQVVLARAIRPYQRIRVSIEHGSEVVRCRGAIAWVRYELRGGKSAGYYRAGLEFVDADEDTIETFCEQHSASETVTE